MNMENSKKVLQYMSFAALGMTISNDVNLNAFDDIKVTSSNKPPLSARQKKRRAAKLAKKQKKLNKK